MHISADQLARQLESELGIDALKADAATLATHTVDGRRPLFVCMPQSPEQCGAVIRICRAADATLAPWGGGTAMAFGNPPLRVDVVITTERLNRLLEHDHANLTVTVESGSRLGALQTAIAPRRQFLPFDPPFPERSTIGGIVAANLNGPRRSHYGSVRDLVIGMKLVLGTGQQIKAGGKVVKNVAGYDMVKLFTGSLGTLGMITELTVKVAPIPEQSATSVGVARLDQTLLLADALAHSKLLPSAVFLCDDAAGRNWQLIVRFEGFERSVVRQLRDLELMAQPLGIHLRRYQSQEEQQVWQPIRDFPLQADRVIYRLAMPPTSLARVLDETQIKNLGASDWALRADLASGTLWIAVAANKTAPGDFANLLACAQRQQGHAVILRAPPELKAGLSVWGPSPPTLSLMRGIKQQFDPCGILNVGRFVGRL